MPIVTRIPTANESPDTTNGIGGDIAVTSPTNTGHASTTATSVGPSDTEVKTCRWHTFQDIGLSNRKSVKLKVTHTSSGNLGGASAANAFDLQYTVNGGSNWNTIVSRLNYTSSQGPTVAEVTLSTTQDLTQVQVRDILDTSALDGGDTADAIATISDIKIEVDFVDGGAAAMFVG